jgi:hypothetical protein
MARWAFMTDDYVKRIEAEPDPVAEKRRQALLKEFGLNADLKEAMDPVPAIRAIVLLGILGLFCTSLFLPAMTYARPNQADGVLPMWALLVAGWAFIPPLFLGELWGIGWLANLMLVGVIIELSVQQERWATMTAVFGVLFAAVSFLVESIPLNNNGPPFPIVSFELGFYLWQGSMLLGLVGSAILWWLDTEANRAPVLEEAATW